MTNIYYFKINFKKCYVKFVNLWIAFTFWVFIPQKVTIQEIFTFWFKRYLWASVPFWYNFFQSLAYWIVLLINDKIFWQFFHKKFKVLQIFWRDYNGLLSIQNNEKCFKKSNMAIHLTRQGNRGQSGLSQIITIHINKVNFFYKPSSFVL